MNDVLAEYGAASDESADRIGELSSQLKTAVGDARLNGYSWGSIAEQLGKTEDETRHWFAEAHEHGSTR
ncbi:hypothetical protein GZ176_11645 [Dermatophilus congolensis]|uniref:hypothetical protein n=1 Tax=Dermatophilus congolensis TaxID=1863 RepID=UPI001AAFDD66|nr:hypothetical protein [Dermatophilus congolensis]MBO3146337.1 hypothetical protein [Dermatophilus congolensis]MBO3148620.1 hypothetical protein [Dermatophilus congolensis]MBO3157573.1 hypothetical protein [Dermatophilus congolensis]MBO3159853.1 hypothetical protein [Dermatophilus congolensis]MBO3166592.1 hypothetical protein [Dermatophilus congolensis]